ncbi:MAG: FYDLN acid domain-containing protein, partial [Pseudomonadota bacterium]
MVGNLDDLIHRLARPCHPLSPVASDPNSPKSGRHEGTDMPKEEWGVKRVCPTTGKRFYDLNRDPIVS